MCGIVGTFRNIQPDEIEGRIRNALSQISYRGPDDLGVCKVETNQGSIWFGHVRLSIIDLSNAGHQPMISTNGRWVIAYNGEIYNYLELRKDLESEGYEFRTSTDTEVLLNAWSHWGKNCIDKLRGMFAFSIYDKELANLSLVRDAFGIKPLYYSIGGDSISWGSEIKLIRSIEPGHNFLNRNVAYNYILSGTHDNSDETFIKSIKRVPPSGILEFNLNSPNLFTVNTWKSFSIQTRYDYSFTDAVERTRELFLNSIKFHLRSDVPIGAALSGGVDSSSIVSSIRQIDRDIPIRTFSYVARGSTFNEEKWVDIVNSHVGAEGHKFVFDSDELFRDYDDLMNVQGEPFSGSSIYALYRTYKEVKNFGVTVTLDGQGADELFAGYTAYPHASIPAYMNEKGIFGAAHYAYKWGQWTSRNSKTGLAIYLRELVSSDWSNRISRKVNVPDWFNSNLNNNLDFQKETFRTFYKKQSGESELSAQLRYALTRNALPNLLRTGDRSSMRWSVESRVPFLDMDLVEFILTMPASYLVSQNGRSKHLFKEAMKGITPQSILNRRDKIGAKTPERLLLKKLIERESFKQAIRNSPLIDYDSFSGFLKNSLEDDSNYARICWRVFSLYDWMATHEVKEM